MNDSHSTLPRKDLFEIPEGLIYLDGNSLGPLPKTVPARVNAMLQAEWGHHLIRGWNLAGWMEQPLSVANRVARLIGAADNTLVLGDTLSIKVYQALSAALTLRPERKVILTDSGNFPSDLYMAQGLIRQLGAGHELRVVDPENVAQEITTDIAAVLLTQVDYRTGRLHDMPELSKRAADANAVMIWDLAHSAGALPVEVEESGCEFAVGCTYKYLNGGPGAPAFIYVRPDVVSEIDPALAGWLGHEAPFAFEPDYRPATSIERFRVGTPPVIQIAALDEALTLWDDVDLHELRKVSVSLCEQFIEEVEARVPQLKLVSPRDALRRGSQVSFAFGEGYAAMQALIERGVIGDFRAPDVMRFGFTPLYIDGADVSRAVVILEEVISQNLWEDPKYKAVGRVT